jgi:hypothetical protein
LNKHYKDLYNIEGFQSNTVVEIDDGFTDYDLELAKLKQVRHVRDKKIDNDFNPDITGEYKDKYLSDYEGDGIFYNEPLKQNSRFINKLSDDGVLKNFRIESDINSYSKEIYYDDMVKIIEKIAKKKDYNINIINPINLEGTLNEKEIQDKVVDKFIEEVNNTFTELNLENKYHKYDERKFKLLSYKVINDSLIENRTEENRNFIFNVIIFREDKDRHFSFQINSNYNFLNNIVSFIQIDIIGIREQENIRFVDLKRPEQKYCILDDNNLNENDFSRFNKDIKIPEIVKCHDEKLKQNKLSLDLFQKEFSENQIKQFIEGKNKMIEEGIEESKFKCFLKDGFNKSTCRSYSKIEKTSGVWDKPCNNNSECPFYKKNKNYDNSRGGCINGYCEMPLNIERVGYKVYLKKNKPFCHNCNKKGCLGEECFECCEEQEDRKKYPNLKSPDYIFSNDGR